MKIFILVSLLIFTLQSSIMNKVILTNQDALCLDGTPGAYYIQEGVGDNKNKFILYFEGGGWCGGITMSNTLQSCYQRSNTDLGSSKNYPDTINMAEGGILSADPTKNPAFYDWTRVFLRYCDGSGHQGTRSPPLNYHNKNLFFRGQNITIAQFQSINVNNQLFTQASQIIVSGGSAGGLAAFLWTNYVAYHAKGKVISVPDSGIFLDVMNIKTKSHTYRTQFINLMNISNAQVNTPVADCHVDHPTQKWRCMFAENLQKYITVPLFPVQPLYDSWSAPNILGIQCIHDGSLKNCSKSDLTHLQQYHTSTKSVLKSITSRNGNGAWAPACANHCYVQFWAWTDQHTFSVPSGSGITSHQAVKKWQQNTETSDGNIHIDNKSWPQNSGCSGATFNKIGIISQ